MFMFIKHYDDKNVSKREADRFAASDLPEATPEMIDHYIAEGNRLRAEMMAKLIRKAFGAVMHPGRTVTAWVRNRRTWSRDDQKLQSS